MVMKTSFLVYEFLKSKKGLKYEAREIVRHLPDTGLTIKAVQCALTRLVGSEKVKFDHSGATDVFGNNKVNRSYWV